MKSPGLKSIGISPRDERGPILMAIALGLGGGLIRQPHSINCWKALPWAAITKW